MKLTEYLKEFEGLDPEEGLQLLIEFGELLPLPSPDAASQFQSGSCRIRECQTPVDLLVRCEEGVIKLEAQVPAKSPTVRGFVAMLVEGLSGATPAEVESVPEDLTSKMGIREALGMTRSQGFAGIIRRIKTTIRGGVNPHGP